MMVDGSDSLLASIREKDVRIKEIDALKQHIFNYSKTRKRKMLSTRHTALNWSCMRRRRMRLTLCRK